MIEATDVVSWLCHYCLHSSVMILAAAGLTRWFDWKSADEEVLWRGVLIAAMLSASFATWRGSTQSLGPMPIPAAGLPGARLEPASEPSAPCRSIPSEFSATRASVERSSSEQGTRRSSRRAADSSSWSIPLPEPAAAVFLALAMGGAILGLGAGVVAVRRARRSLRGRTELLAGSLHDRLQRLERQAGIRKGVRISVAPHLSLPVSFDWGTPEICLPPLALKSLTLDQQEAMLAHELAHLRRRDSWWWLAFLPIRCLAMIQPLTHLVLRRLDSLTERCCDDWAAKVTGKSLDLASCLIEVSAWASCPKPAVVAGMAHSRSEIGHRVRRLLRDPATEPSRSPPKRYWWLGFLVASGLAWLPTVSVVAEPLSPGGGTPRDVAAQRRRLRSTIQELHLLKQEIIELRDLADQLSEEEPELLEMLDSLWDRQRSLHVFASDLRSRLATGTTQQVQEAPPNQEKEVSP